MLNFLTQSPETLANLSSSFIMMMAMIAFFYFAMIRPENKRKKETEQMRSSIHNGDVVVSIGGIMGTVVDVKEDKVVIETGADRVRIELAKWGISANETAEKKAAAEAQKKKEAEAKAKAAKKAGK